MWEDRNQHFLYLIIIYFCFSQSVHAVACSRGVPIPFYDRYISGNSEALPRKRFPLLPLGGSSLQAGQPPLDHSHAFGKSRQIGHAEFTKRLQRSHTVNTNVEAKAELNTSTKWLENFKFFGSKMSHSGDVLNNSSVAQTGPGGNCVAFQKNIGSLEKQLF